MPDLSERTPPTTARPEAPPDVTTDDSSSPCGEDPAEEPVGAATGIQRGQRPRLNFWLDVTTALTLCAMVGSGVLLEFVLPHRGGSTWLGWTRHDWGEVHFWLGTVLLASVVLHLVQHRDWIARCWRRFAGNLRSPVTWALLLAGLALMVAPLLIPSAAGSGGRRRQGGEAQAGPGTAAGQHDGRGAPGGRGRGRRALDRSADRW